jgi:5-deoxy-glucuronate isomerase
MQYDSSNLVISPGRARDPQVVVEITPERAGWEYIHFQVRRLERDQACSFATGEHELALIMLGGRVDVASNRGAWRNIGARANVFAGLPHALYLPRHTTFTVTAQDESEFAVAWVVADQDYQPQVITPAAIEVEIRGGDNCTRQINAIVPPGFACQRLVVVEVYTPGGNWSSYPPHKHDRHIVNADGQLVEADLEEVYFYKFDRPDGYAYQRIYTAPDSPLHEAGSPIDSVLLARDNDLVLVPEGYHPVAVAPGATGYYLNVLAGSAQSLANTDDPQFAWIKDSYRSRDPRVPIYDVSDGEGSA